MIKEEDRDLGVKKKKQKRTLQELPESIRNSNIRIMNILEGEEREKQRKNSQGSHGKKTINYKGNPIRLTSDFSVETL